MEALLFLGNRPVERIAADAIPQVVRVLRLTGHRVRWQPDVGCLFVDSPLEGRIIGCRVHGDARGVAAQSLDELFRWVRMAGGVPAAPGIAADAVIRLVAEPCAAGDLPSILVAGGRRRWFLRRQGGLVTAVADCLRDLVDVPVGVVSRPTDGAEVEVRIRVPPETRVSQAVARAIWLALMATCGRPPGERTLSTAWVVQVREWWDSRAAAEEAEPPAPPRPAAGPRAVRPALRPPVDAVVARRPRIVWESEGRDPLPRTAVLPESGTPDEGAPPLPVAVFAPAAPPEGAAAGLEGTAPAQAPWVDLAGPRTTADAPAEPGATGTAADASPAPGISAAAPEGAGPNTVAGAAPTPAATAVVTEAAPKQAVTVAGTEAAPKPAAPENAAPGASHEPGGPGASDVAPSTPAGTTGAAAAAASTSNGTTGAAGTVPLAAGAETAAEPAPPESTRRRVAAASHTYRFPVFGGRSSQR
ncbi:MAG: hypothetical protein AB2385_07475 [Symbiobacterium sp.]|uniref:hypothetical protein n=1 Tax=Symbiobacterium sp. TaxID=1971213 RepID=UPI003464D653